MSAITINKNKLALVIDILNDYIRCVMVQITEKDLIRTSYRARRIRKFFKTPGVSNANAHEVVQNIHSYLFRSRNLSDSEKVNILILAFLIVLGRRVRSRSIQNDKKSTYRRQIIEQVPPLFHLLIDEFSEQPFFQLGLSIKTYTHVWEFLDLTSSERYLTHLLYTGYNRTEIAKLFNIHPSNVSYLFKQIQEKLQWPQ